MSHDNAAKPPSLPRDEVLNVLRRIADHDDAPETIQADARTYLQTLEAAAFGSGPLKGEAHAIGDLQIAPQVMEKLPRPRRATG